MPVPKEQPPRKLSGPEDRRCRKNLERSRPCPGRRRDNDLRQKDRWGIAGLTCWVGSWDAGMYPSKDTPARNGRWMSV